MNNLTVTIQGQPVICQLERKAIRHVYLKIRSDGTVLLSIPQRMDEQTVLTFIQSKAAWLGQKLQLIQASAQRKRQLSESGQVRFLGKSLELKLVPGKKAAVTLSENTAYLSVPDKSSTEVCLSRAMKDVLSKTVDILKQPYDRFLISRHKVLPDISYRHMKSRWGSCSPAKNKIVLNTALAACHPDLIEAVLWHEYAHLFVGGHSAAFYELVCMQMPDYKQRRARLKKEEITL